jgi:acetyltransferase-like isoleucine patch superfamily enzyme
MEVKNSFISTSGVFKTPFSIIVLIQFLEGMFIVIFTHSWYVNNLYYYFTGKVIFPLPIHNALWVRILLILLIPLNVYATLYLFSFSIITFSIIVFKILNMICPPREGRFKKGSKEWKYMNRRFWTAYFPIWLARALPLPWVDIVAYRFFGVRIGKNVVLYEGYVDPLFVEIGDFTMTSLNICIFSHLIYHDQVIIRKVQIGEACVVGPHTIVSPGTIMEDRAILGANSYTDYDQKLESDLIHVGTPVNIKLPLQSVEDSQKKVERVKTEKTEEED